MTQKKSAANFLFFLFLPSTQKQRTVLIDRNPPLLLHFLLLLHVDITVQHMSGASHTRVIERTDKKEEKAG
jgi:hypothetical protein